MPASSRLAELVSLAERAGALAQEIRGDAIQRDLKGDGSIVTEADRSVERMLREELPKLVPGTNVWGEEYGFEEEGPNGLWVVDPVDGTSNFSFGSHLWGVSIGLVQSGEITMGAVALPDLGESYAAEKGGGVYREGKALAPIPSGPIKPFELVSYSDSFLRNYSAAHLRGRLRITGAFVVEGCYTASQRYRGLVGYNESLYDVAACVLMGQELGAEIRYADGARLEISSLVRQGSIGRPWVIFPRDSGYLLKSE